MHFSEHIPIVKWCMTINTFLLLYLLTFFFFYSIWRYSNTIFCGSSSISDMLSLGFPLFSTEILTPFFDSFFLSSFPKCWHFPFLLLFSLYTLNLRDTITYMSWISNPSPARTIDLQNSSSPLRSVIDTLNKYVPKLIHFHLQACSSLIISANVTSISLYKPETSKPLPPLSSHSSHVNNCQVL